MARSIDREPEPGSPADVMQRGLLHAFAAGHCSFSACWDRRSRVGSPPAFGEDAVVSVSYRPSATPDAEPWWEERMRLDRVWQLVMYDPETASVGNELLHLGAPIRDREQPYAFVAAAQVYRGPVRHDLAVWDLQGGVELVVTDSTLRSSVMKWADRSDRQRAEQATRNMPPDTAGAIFGAAVWQRIVGDPVRRGLDARPALTWSYKTVTDGVETVVAVSDPMFTPDPIGRTAGFGIRALVQDEFNRTEVDALGSTATQILRPPADWELNYASRTLEWEDPTGDKAVPAEMLLEAVLRDPRLDLRDVTIFRDLANGASQEEIAAKLGVTQERVSQIRKAALKKLGKSQI